MHVRARTCTFFIGLHTKQVLSVFPGVLFWQKQTRRTKLRRGLNKKKGQISDNVLKWQKLPLKAELSSGFFLPNFHSPPSADLLHPKRAGYIVGAGRCPCAFVLDDWTPAAMAGAKSYTWVSEPSNPSLSAIASRAISPVICLAVDPHWHEPPLAPP